MKCKHNDYGTCKLSDLECPTGVNVSCANQEQESVKYCKYCFNARVYEPTDEELMDPFSTELTDENDSSSHGVGHSCGGYTIYINSGNGKPLNVEFMRWDDKTRMWSTRAIYEPKYCPECGRRLDEYEKVNNND